MKASNLKTQLTVEKIRMLKPLSSQSIDKQWEDDNKHINVGFYMDTYNKSGWPMFELMGINRKYFSERQLGVVDLENHIRYLRELHVGNQITAYSRFLNCDDKRLHGAFFIVNDDSNELACSIEFLCLSIDHQLRKSVPFPEDIRINLEKQVKVDQKLGWEFPAVLTLDRT